jgi:hypothetical protein
VLLFLILSLSSSFCILVKVELYHPWPPWPTVRGKSSNPEGCVRCDKCDFHQELCYQCNGLFRSHFFQLMGKRFIQTLTHAHTKLRLGRSRRGSYDCDTNA